MGESVCPFPIKDKLPARMIGVLRLTAGGHEPQSVQIYSGNCQSASPDGPFSGSQVDFDVISKAVQTFHQFALREIREVTAH